MYFKYEAKIEEIHFPLLVDFNFDIKTKKFTEGLINFHSGYSLIFPFNFYKTIVLLPVENQKINRGLVITKLNLPIDSNFYYYSLVFQNTSKIIPEVGIGIKNNLHDHLIKTIDMLRWRFKLLGSHDYLIEEEFHFSINVKIWHKIMLRKDVTVYLESPATSLNYKIVLGSRELIQEKEALEYEIFREAFYNHQKNPRSSLIMAITAAEVGFKRLAAELHPQNEWLLENLPSPPLLVMLKRYLPILPVKLDINGEVLIPSNIRKILDKAIKKRNKIIHTGFSEIDEKELREILTAVKDLLYLFDYYRGYKWAASNLSIKTGELLGFYKKITD